MDAQSTFNVFLQLTRKTEELRGFIQNMTTYLSYESETHLPPFATESQFIAGLTQNMTQRYANLGNSVINERSEEKALFLSTLKFLYKWYWVAEQKILAVTEKYFSTPPYNAQLLQEEFKTLYDIVYNLLPILTADKQSHHVFCADMKLEIFSSSSLLRQLHILRQQWSTVLHPSVLPSATQLSDCESSPVATNGKRQRYSGSEGWPGKETVQPPFLSPSTTHSLPLPNIAVMHLGSPRKSPSPSPSPSHVSSQSEYHEAFNTSPPSRPSHSLPPEQAGFLSDQAFPESPPQISQAQFAIGLISPIDKQHQHQHQHRPLQRRRRTGQRKALFPRHSGPESVADSSSDPNFFSDPERPLQSPDSLFRASYGSHNPFQAPHASLGYQGSGSGYGGYSPLRSPSSHFSPTGKRGNGSGIESGSDF